MTGPLALIGHSARRVRTLVLVMGLLLGCFQVLLNLVAGSIQRSNMFDQVGALVPSVVRQLMGSGFVAILSFGGIVCVGWFHPVVMGCLVGLMIALATETASEIETGFIDLILSRPVGRHWPVTRSAVVLTGSLVFLLAAMMSGTLAGLRWLAPEGAAWPAPRLLWSLAINLGALVLCWGGVALAVGSVSRRRSVAGAVVGVTALATFLLDYLARAWEPAKSVSWISPFHYYDSMELVTGGRIPPWNLGILAGVAVGGLACAYVAAARRDLCGAAARGRAAGPGGASDRVLS